MGPPLPSSPRGEVSIRLASLDNHPSLSTNYFALNGFSVSHLFDEGQIFHDLALNV
jgi:hypothetical protein